MHVYKIIIAILFIIQAYQHRALAQNKSEVAISYSDGILLFGKIVQEDISSIHLYMPEFGDTIYLSKSGIKSIKNLSESYLLHGQGTYHHINGTYFSADYHRGNKSLQIGIELGHRFNSKASLGFGTAITRMTADVNQLYLHDTFFPLYVSGRYYLSKGFARFYLGGRFGYSLIKQSNSWRIEQKSGGLFIQPSIGLHFASRKKRKISVFISHILQKTSGSREIRNWQSNESSIVNYNHLYNRFMVGMTWEFF